MMLRWREIHPYNAVHVAHVECALDSNELRRCIAAAIEAQGLGGLAFDARCRRFVYRGGVVDPELSVLATPSDGGGNMGGDSNGDGGSGGDAGSDCDRILSGEIERQLNRPFAIGAPMRFFAMPMQDGFLLGIAYDHFIAGGDSIAALLGTVAASIARPVSPRASSVAPLPPYPPTYSTLVRRHIGWFITALAAMPALVRESKRAFRPRDDNPDDRRNAYALIRVAPTETAALRAQARVFGVTLHDLVVALLLRTLSPFAIDRRNERRRRKIGVASIVNIRRDFDGDNARAFGQLLASMHLTHAVPDGIGVRELARDVRSATLPIKRSHLYLRTLFGLSVASWSWRFMSTAQRNRFYSKHHPTWAGISMLDVDPLWPEALGPANLYTRGVSTGPLTPAVLAISATSTALSIGVSWRPTALSADFPNRLQSEIQQCVLQNPC